MADLDEQIQQHIAEQEELKRQEFEAGQQQERMQKIQSLAQRSQTIQNTAQEVKKWSKRARWLIWIAEGLIATVWIWGPLLLFLVVISSFAGGCNGSKIFRVASLGSCEPFISSSADTVIVNPEAPRPPTGGLTDAEARRLLAQANICNYPLGWSKVDCVNASEPQTSLNGMQQVTLNEIIRFKSQCDIWARSNGGGVCEVVVSGGTEPTGDHASGQCSHLSGNKIDIRPTALIDRYINSSNFTHIANRGSDSAAQYKNNSTGVTYARESNHWDIGGVGCA